MMSVYQPPLPCHIVRRGTKVFLAGTIDNGAAFDWQNEVIQYLGQVFAKELELHIFNPRRKDWNSEWSKNQNHPMLERQIEWERLYLQSADLVAMVFLKHSKSPISFLEMGEFKHKHMLVYCPKGFYREANVRMFCRDNNVELIEDWDIFKITLKRHVGKLIIQKALA